MGISSGDMCPVKFSRVTSLETTSIDIEGAEVGTDEYCKIHWVRFEPGEGDVPAFIALLERNKAVKYRLNRTIDTFTLPIKLVPEEEVGMEVDEEANKNSNKKLQQELQGGF